MEYQVWSSVLFFHKTIFEHGLMHARQRAKISMEFLYFENMSLTII